MFIGKTGAGKSTLIDNLLHNQLHLPVAVLSPEQATQENNFITTDQHGVTLKIYNTVGLEPHEGGDLLMKLSDDINGQADLVILCIPVAPGAGFIDKTPDIMRKLQEEFSKNIWKCCVIVLAFSNVAYGIDARRKALNLSMTTRSISLTMFKRSSVSLVYAMW